MLALDQSIGIHEEDRLRADFYNFLGLILARPPDQMTLDQTAGLRGDKSEFGRSINILAKVATRTTCGSAVTEYNKLFIGLGRGELLPYASYYMTGFLNEKPLAVLREDLSRLGITRSETVFEPEDNIASLMEVMGALIVGRFSSPAGTDEQQAFFDRHIAPWAGHFFADLEGAKSSVLYAAVGKLGRLFMEIETEAFRMAPA